MSYFDTRRDPVPPPDMSAMVDARQPGTSSAPATQYQSVPSAGHKVPAARRRTQVQINASSGERLDARTAAMLDAAVEGLSDRDHHELLRAKAMGTAVGAHLRAADRVGGYLSTGAETFTRIAGPHEMIRHLFGIGG